MTCEVPLTTSGLLLGFSETAKARSWPCQVIKTTSLSSHQRTGRDYYQNTTCV